MVEIVCSHVCKWKNETSETFPGVEEDRIEENDGGGELNYDIL
jgi:hypothetical protein